MAKTKIQTKSQDYIAELKKSGLSYSAIGKALGRDSSLIAQGAKGKKPLANLEAGLKKLVDKQKPDPPERRVTKSGKVAEVRKPTKPEKVVKEIEALTDKKKRIVNAQLDGLSSKEINQILKKIKNDGGVISFTALAHGYKKYRQMKPGDVNVILFEDGLDAEDFSQVRGGIESKLITALLDEYDVSQVKSLSDIQLNAFY